MVLDGVMMILTAFFLSAAHPGLVFGERWKTGGFHWRQGEKEAQSNSTSSTYGEAA